MKVKLDEHLIKGTLKLCGKNPKSILLGMMTVTMVSSMSHSEHRDNSYGGGGTHAVVMEF